MTNPADALRQGIAALGITDFDQFASSGYAHTDQAPRGRMGNYREFRLPEQNLRAIWLYLTQDLGIPSPRRPRR